MNKATLLIVEDNEDLILFLTKDLGATYDIIAAPNGEAALEKLQAHAVRLIISDVMMPKMDGFEFCEKVKSSLEFSHIPFILLTAKNTLQSKIEGLKNGADAYIEKPFSPDHLEAQIFSLLQNRTKIKEHYAKLPLVQLSSIASSEADETFLNKLQKVIENHITDPSLNVDYLATAVNMSRPVFYRKIKAISDLSPYEMINLTRLKKAAGLLQTSKASIGEIGVLVGYTSTAHFSRNFKRQFGITPSEYAQGK